MISDAVSAAPAPRLSASVVTFDNASCLPEFLDDLRRQSGVAWEAHFLDNGSRDATLALLRAAALGSLEPSAENLGYGGGHNRNLSHCRGEYVLLLNADLRLPAGLFAGLVAYLDARPDVAFATPRILEGDRHTPFPPRRFYPGEGMLPLLPGLRRRGIGWLSGCCLAARRAVLEALGGFDTAYFLYQAETDLCLRARRAGHGLGCADHLVTHHLHRQSQRALSPYEHALRIYEGSVVFWQRHYPPHEVWRLVRFQLALCRLLLPIAHVPGLRRRGGRALDVERLRARRDICRQWMSHQRTRPAAPPDAPRRSILARQLAIAFLWLTTRRFPLDDY